MNQRIALSFLNVFSFLNEEMACSMISVSSFKFCVVLNIVLDEVKTRVIVELPAEARTFKLGKSV